MINIVHFFPLSGKPIPDELKHGVNCNHMRENMGITTPIHMEQELGRQWLHHNGPEQIQPVRDCNGCSLSNL